MRKQLLIECKGLQEISTSHVSRFGRSLFLALADVDSFLIAALNGDIVCQHRIDPDSSFAKLKLDSYLSDGNALDADKEAVLNDYLSKWRIAIFTAPHDDDDCINDLLRDLTAAATEVDALVNPQLSLYDSKILNRVAYYKAIERVTSITGPGKNGVSFKLISGDFHGEITSLTKRRAEDLLGGKYMDKTPHGGNYLVSKVPFENIQGRAEFMLDGKAIVVFITDKKWIKEFNAGKIKLAKNDRIRARALIERSPANKNAVVYYFVEIEGINL